MGALRLLAVALLLLTCLQELFSLFDNVVVHSFQFPHYMDPVVRQEKSSVFLPYISPNSAPQASTPLKAPSPLEPYLNHTVPKLSGHCPLNFSAVENLMSTTAVDCWTSFAPFLANVICCPQLQATLVILIGQNSRNTGMLALSSTHASHCLSDIQEILRSQGASDDLEHICSIHPENLTEASCPINSVDGLESAVDSSRILDACKNVDPVNECCGQVCQDAVLDAASKIALQDGSLASMDASNGVHIPRIDDCKNIVLRWISNRLEPTSAKEVIRGIWNCNVNGVCPLVFPGTKDVANHCQGRIQNYTACCNAMGNYVSHLQKQSFITNLQALNCATLLGIQLQKMNISTNVYSSCHITLKDFSLQVGNQDFGCLLPSLPSDATLDTFSGISFTCDLNDNIAAPWPTASFISSSSTCNKTVKFPALPAATSTQGSRMKNMKLLLHFFLLVITLIL